VELVLKALEEHAPGLRDLVLHQQLLTPLDLEREYGLSEGCIFHGQMALDQLWFMRPVPGPAPYHTPIPNLFLCGAGSHPGGGVTGAPGRNAARVVIHEIDK
jgi:phytoene dehydrogenase-like protein